MRGAAFPQPLIAARLGPFSMLVSPGLSGSITQKVLMMSSAPSSSRGGEEGVRHGLSVFDLLSRTEYVSAHRSHFRPSRSLSTYIGGPDEMDVTLSRQDETIYGSNATPPAERPSIPRPRRRLEPQQPRARGAATAVVNHRHGEARCCGPAFGEGTARATSPGLPWSPPTPSAQGTKGTNNNNTTRRGPPPRRPGPGSGGHRTVVVNCMICSGLIFVYLPSSVSPAD